MPHIDFFIEVNLVAQRDGIFFRYADLPDSSEYVFYTSNTSKGGDPGCQSWQVCGSQLGQYLAKCRRLGIRPESRPNISGSEIPREIEDP